MDVELANGGTADGEVQPAVADAGNGDGAGAELQVVEAGKEDDGKVKDPEDAGNGDGGVAELQVVEAGQEGEKKDAARILPSSSSPWASLLGDLVRLIACRVLSGDLVDYVYFRAVCTGWRSATDCPLGRGVTDPRFHPRRWMMMTEGHNLYPGKPKLGGYVRFFNLDTGVFVRVRLPLFSNHCAIDSVDGLLLLHRDHDTAIRLLHPFTGDIAELPPLATLLWQLGNPFFGDSEAEKWCYIRYNICASVSCNAGIITVMLGFSHFRIVAFATSTDQQWTLTSWKVPHKFVHSSFLGKLYTVHNPAPNTDAASHIFEIDPPLHDERGLGSQQPPPPKLVATCPPNILHWPLYLVECDSEILVVGHSDSSFSRILVYKLADLMLGRFIPVSSIGDCALFLENRTMCVSSKSLPTVMAETIFYTHPTKDDFVQYQLDTGIWSRPVDECGLEDFPPGPCSLIHHLRSCCIRNFWNKGVLYSEKGYGLLGSWKSKEKFRHWF